MQAWRRKIFFVSATTLLAVGCAHAHSAQKVEGTVMSPEISVVDYYRGVLTPNVGERVIEDGYPAVSSCNFDFTAKRVFISTWTEGKTPRPHGTYKLRDRDLEKLKSYLTR